MKSGFISIIGRPNVGKSTLLNSIMQKKIAITSSKAQTTRNNIQGIYTKDDVQMVFVDTPGIHKPKYKLGKVLNKQAYYTLDDVDVILFVVDITGGIGKGDKFIINMLQDVSKPVFLIINKIDKLPKEEILGKINEYKDLYDFKEIIPISAYKNDNVRHLLDVIKGYLKDEIKYYPDDMTTDKDDKFIISELIREKILKLTEEEIPHSVACVIETMDFKKDIVNINALIIVDRPNVKKIIIGSGGHMIKKIGMQARYDIENYLNKKVYLELYVKVVPKWRDKEKFLNQIGFQDFGS